MSDCDIMFKNRMNYFWTIRFRITSEKPVELDDLVRGEVMIGRKILLYHDFIGLDV